MKIAALQSHIVVGDFAGNAKRLVDAYQHAVSEGAEIVLAQEDALAGYCEGDQRFYPSFMEGHDAALDMLTAGIGDVALVMSITVQNPSKGKGKPFLNMGVLIQSGVVTYLQAKTNLATDAVFNDYRWYEMNHEDILVFTYRGVRCAVLICQDLWSTYDAAHGEHFFPRNPVLELEGKGVELLLVPNASPYYWGKGTVRHEMVRAVTSQLGAAVAYANFWGGQDELVFDGRSFIMNKDGVVVGAAKAYEDAIVLADLDGAPVAYPFDKDDIQALEDTLVVSLREYVEKSGIAGVVLGVSGGIDSALVAYLAVRALGPERVIGIRMPSEYSSEGSLVDAEALCRNLGIRMETIAIKGIHQMLRDALATAFAKEKFWETPCGATDENLQARTRGELVMGFANYYGYMALATGNKSEFSVGYATLYGDMCGGFALIKDALKQEVYALSRHANRDGVVVPISSIDKPPSAELKPGQVDTDSLPDYPVLDALLKAHIEKFKGIEELVAAGFDRDVARKVIGMTARAEFKRRQAPIGPIVSREGLGWLNRQYPISTTFLP